MIVTVKPVDGDTYIIDNVVSINYILGDVIIQYIKYNEPRTVSFKNDDARIVAIIL